MKTTKDRKSQIAMALGKEKDEGDIAMKIAQAEQIRKTTAYRPVYNFQIIVKYIVILALIGFIIYVVIEWKKFSNTPIGKAMTSVMGKAAALMQWAATHPWLALLGVLGIAILWPIVTGLSRGVGSGIKEKISDMISKQKEGLGEDNTAVENEALSAAAAEEITTDLKTQISKQGGNLSQQEMDAQIAQVSSSNIEAQKEFRENANDLDENLSDAEWEAQMQEQGTELKEFTLRVE